MVIENRHFNRSRSEPASQDSSLLAGHALPQRPWISEGKISIEEIYLLDIGRSELLSAKDELRIAREVRSRELKVREQLELIEPPYTADKRVTKGKRLEGAERELRDILKDFFSSKTALRKLETSYKNFACGARSFCEEERVLLALNKLMEWELRHKVPCFKFYRQVTALRELERRRDEVCIPLVEANTRLVPSMLKKFRDTKKIFYTEEEFPELIQEGNIALMKAARGFDPERGFKFSTYAGRAILQNCRRYLSQKFAKEKRLPVAGSIREYDFAEREGTLPEREVAAAEIQEKLGELIADMLTPREKLVLTLYFGLYDLEGNTLEDIGKRLGVSRQGAANIRDLALQKLREALPEDF